MKEVDRALQAPDPSLIGAPGGAPSLKAPRPAVHLFVPLFVPFCAPITLATAQRQRKVRSAKGRLRFMVCSVGWIGCVGLGPLRGRLSQACANDKQVVISAQALLLLKIPVETPYGAFNQGGWPRSVARFTA